MIWIASYLIGWRAKAAVIAAGVVALIGLRAWDISNQRAKGAAIVVEASKAAGAEANAKSEKVRLRAREPGAADRLRKDRATCPDC